VCKDKLFIMKIHKTFMLFALGISALLNVSCRNSAGNVSVEDEFTGYDDIISLIIEGYAVKWDGISPEENGLSSIYLYRSQYGGFAIEDIDGDGTDELILGDQFDDGSYQIYDLYTHDSTTGDMYHLFCGGERDYCTVNGDGIICECGSNSAADSFVRYYKIKNLKLKELKGQSVNMDLRNFDFECFANSSFYDE